MGRGLAVTPKLTLITIPIAIMRSQVPGDPITVSLAVGVQHYTIVATPHGQKVSLLLPQHMPTAVSINHGYLQSTSAMMRQ
jgi:hypothetical protein